MRDFRNCPFFPQLTCLRFEVVVNWNDYMELGLEHWFILKYFMRLKQQKLTQFSYGLMSQGLL